MPGLPLAWRVRTVMRAFLVPPLVHVVSLRRLATDRVWKGVPSAALDDRVLAAFVDDLLRRLPWPWSLTCLKRASVLFGLLRRAGRPVELCIGARRGDDGAFMAHAWLTLHGEVYLEPNPEIPAAHTLVARFPEAATRR